MQPLILRRPARMGLVAAALAWLVAGAGCRGLLDIEDLELAGDGGAGTDAGAVEDARRDTNAPVDTGSPDTGAPVCARGAGCLKCCKESFGMQTPTLEQQMREKGCICGSGACTSECGSTMCATPALQPAAPPNPCVPCVDGLILATPAPSAACQQAFTACSNQVNCRDVMRCLTECR